MLDKRQRNILNLIRRSTPDSDGWYSVSKVVMPLVEMFPRELIVVENYASGAGRIKLTEKGRTVDEYC